MRSAAQEPGAPLCGNRVFSTSNGDVFAERGANVSEKLFNSTDGSPYTELLNVLHGGRRIQIGDYLEYKWIAKGAPWIQTALAGTYHQDAGGAFLSWYDGSDHDATAYLISNSVLAQGNVVTTPLLYHTGGNPFGRPFGQIIRPIRELNGALVCASGMAASALKSTCGDTLGLGLAFVGSWKIPHGYMPYALAPQGNFILQSVNYHFISNFVAAVYSSSGGLTNTSPPVDTSESVELWMVDTAANSTPFQIPLSSQGGLSKPGVTVEWMAIDELGTELVWQVGKYGYDHATGMVSCTQRLIEYRALPGHPSVSAGTLTRPAIPQSDTSTCQSFGPATFAPLRLGPAATVNSRNIRQRAASRPRPRQSR